MKNKMQLLLLVLLLAVGSCANSQQKGYLIEGVIKGIPDQKVTLTMNGESDADEVLQSTQVVNGKFMFKGQLTRPPAILDIQFEDKQHRLLTGDLGLRGGTLLVDNGQEYKIDITVDPKNISTNAGYIFPSVKLSSSYAPFAEIRRINKDIYEKFDLPQSEILQKMGANPQETIKKSNQIEEDRSNYYATYIKKNPKSIVSTVLMFKFLKDSTMASALDPSLKSSTLYASYIRDLNDFLMKAKMSSEAVEGSTFKDFTMQDLDGKDVKMSSLLKDGEYVLLDFWASWCGPCRAENPNLLKAYNKFFKKGFKVVAVSLDRSKASWLRAVKEDGMPWIHISDLKEWNGEVVKQYGITSIPENFLLDGKGKIVAKGLRSAKLEKVLSELLGQ